VSVTGSSKEVAPANRQTFTLSASNAANITPSTKQASVAVRGLNLLAGSMGGTGMRDAVGTLASFQRPQNMCVAGNFLYVADTSNHIVRKVDLTTALVTTIAGGAGISGTTDVLNGDPLAARFNSPRGIAVDAQGYIWVADGSNNAIRVISPDNKYVYTVTGWSGTTVYTGTSTYGGPQHLVVNNDGTTCTAYLATYNGTLLQLNITGLGSTTTAPAASISKTFIINGTTAGSNSSVGSCALVTVGSTPVIFVPDTVNDTIKACYLDGSGNPQVANVTPASPTLVDPAAVAASLTGTTATVFVANKHSVVRYSVDLSTVPASAPTVSASTPVVVGSGSVGVADGAGDVAAFGGPQGLALNGSTLFVAEGSYQWSSSPNLYSNCIRTIAAATTAPMNTGMTVSTFAGVNRAAAYVAKIPTTGTSTGVDARFKTPSHVAVDANGNTYLADRGNSRIVMIAPDGTTSNFPSDGTTWTAIPLAAVPDTSVTPSVYVIESGSATLKKFTFGSATPETITLSSTYTAVNQAVYFKSGTDEYLFTVDGSGKNLKRIELTGATPGTVTTVYTTTASGLFGLAVSPAGIAYLTEGSRVISIPALSPTTPTVIAGGLTTYGFVDGAGASALFNYPGTLAYGVDGAQGYVYVVDGRNSALRMITLGATNDVSTLLGRFNGTTSTSSPFYTSAMLGILPGLLEPDTTPTTKGLAGSITISTLTTQGLAVTPAGDLVIVACDSVMQLTAPLNK
jgi:sugar lactone lactonase YvrE